MCFTARKHGVSDVSQDVLNLVSHATQERLRNILEKVSTISLHRLEVYRVCKTFLFAVNKLFSHWKPFSQFLTIFYSKFPFFSLYFSDFISFYFSEIHERPTKLPKRSGEGGSKQKLIQPLKGFS